MSTTGRTTQTSSSTARTAGTLARRLRRAALSLAVAGAAVVGLSVSPAAALSSPSAHGAYGGLTTNGVQGTSVYYKEPTALYGSQVAAVNVTGGTVSRSLATSGAQRVEHRFNLYRYVNGGWSLAYSSPTTVNIIPVGYSAVILNPSAVRIPTVGYYRVTFSLTWRDAYGTYLGARNYDYNAQSDYRCLVGGCSTGPGWMYL